MVNTENITALDQLQEYPCWVCWREEKPGGKRKKVPYDPKTGFKASTTDPTTWSDYETAVRTSPKYDGLGFVFSDKNPFSGIDLDNCIEDGTVQPWATDIVRELNSYTEKSPRGRGLHIIVVGKLDKELSGNKQEHIEIYSRGRYFTFTGKHYEGSPETIEERQPELIQLHQEYFPNAIVQSTQTSHATASPIADDEELLRSAREAKNGDKFIALFDEGDTSAYNDDDSSADLALCNFLAFWCGNDPERIDRLFRMSALCREKWENRPDYRQRTIESALQQCTESGLRGTLDDIRRRKPPPFERRKLIAQGIHEELQNCGKFIHSADKLAYYFLDEKHKLYKIIKDDSEFENLLYEVAGLNKADQDWLYVFNDLLNQAQIYGQKSSVWQFCRYQDNKLYLSRFDGTVYILDGEDIRTENNGVNGILFLDQPDWQPWKIEPQNKDFTIDDFISQIHFDSAGSYGLNLQQYQHLFKTVIFCLYFIDLLPTKPIVAFIGEKGSGKTSIVRRKGKLFFGSSFDVRSLARDKEDAFTVMVSKEHFLALDNVDASIPWLNDRLSTIATGNAITMRELYTTNSERRIYPRCIVALSSRTPHFRRDDVADRLLIFRVKRIPDGEYISERSLLRQIAQNRNRLLGELVTQLNVIVAYLNEHDISKETSNFRLADFAILGKAIGVALGGDKAGIEWEHILAKMKVEQDDFALEDDSLPIVLIAWMRSDSQVGPISPSTLFKELKAVAVSKGIDFDYKDTKALGRRLGNIKSNLEQLGIVIRERRGHGNIMMRTFYKIDTKSEV